MPPPGEASLPADGTFEKNVNNLTLTRSMLTIFSEKVDDRKGKLL